MADTSHTPPAAVKKAAQEGLDLRRTHGRGGIGPGQARARQLTAGKPVPLADIQKMNAYFARHRVDKQGADWANKDKPSNGYIAWQLWGGDAGAKWAADLCKREAEDGHEKASFGDPSRADTYVVSVNEGNQTISDLIEYLYSHSREGNIALVDVRGGGRSRQFIWDGQGGDDILGFERASIGDRLSFARQGVELSGATANSIYTLSVIDSDKSLLDLLQFIKKCGDDGHSIGFKIDDQSFGFDGDGSDKIVKIDVAACATPGRARRNLYFLQPGGSWKKGGDGRSEGRTKEELPKGAEIADAETPTGPVDRTSLIAREAVSLFRGEVRPHDGFTLHDAVREVMSRESGDPLIEDEVYNAAVETIKLNEDEHGSKIHAKRPVPMKRQRPIEPETAETQLRTLYVCRKVVNADDIVRWAKKVGLGTIDGSELHCTLAYSTRPLDWLKVGQAYSEQVNVVAGGPRLLERLGPPEKPDTIVLGFVCDEFTGRWQQIRDAGAEWKHNDFVAHVSLTKDPEAKIDIEAIEPYQGNILFGPEVFERVRDDRAAVMADRAQRVIEHRRAFGVGHPFEVATTVDLRQFKKDLMATRWTGSPAALGPDGRGWRVKREGSAGEAYIVMRMPPPAEPGKPPSGAPPTYYRPSGGKVWDLDEAVEYGVQHAKIAAERGANEGWEWDRAQLAAHLPPVPTLAKLATLNIDLVAAASYADSITVPNRVFPIPAGQEICWYSWVPRLERWSEFDRKSPNLNFQGLLPLHRMKVPVSGVDTVFASKRDVIGLITLSSRLPGITQPDVDFLVIFPGFDKSVAFAGRRTLARMLRAGHFHDADLGDSPPDLTYAPAAGNGTPAAPVPSTPPVSTYDAETKYSEFFYARLQILGVDRVLNGGFEGTIEKFKTTMPTGLAIMADPVGNARALDHVLYTAKTMWDSFIRARDARLKEVNDQVARRDARLKAPTNIRTIKNRIKPPAGQPQDAPLVLSKGTPVLALFAEDGLWYPATFVKMMLNDQFYIIWDEGGAYDTVDRVKPKPEHDISSLHPGSRIEAVAVDGLYYPARVVEIVGTKVVLRWEDGNEREVIPFKRVHLIYPDAEGAPAVDEFDTAVKGSDTDKLEYLGTLWHDLNEEKFDGKLNPPNIIWMRTPTDGTKLRTRAYWSASKRVIACSRRLFNNRAALYETFLHEMCHQAVSEINFTVERINKGHGPLWKGWMVKVGLDPRQFDARGNEEYMSPEERAEFDRKKALKQDALANNKPVLAIAGRPAKWFDAKQNTFHVGRLVSYQGGKYKFWAFVDQPEQYGALRWMRIPLSLLYECSPEEAASVSTAMWDDVVRRVGEGIQRNKQVKAARRTTKALWGY